MSDKKESRLAWPMNPAHHMRSLRSRFLLLLGVVLVLSLVFVWDAVYYFVYRIEQEAWQGRQQEAALNAAETVSDFVQDLRHTLILVGSVDSDYLAGHPQVTQELLEGSPALLEIACIGLDGHVVASAYRDAPLLANLFTIPQSTWFRKALAGELYLGDVQVSSDGEPYLIVSVLSPRGNVLVARARMRVLWDVVAALRFGKTGQAYIANRQGRIVAHSQPEVVLAKMTLAGQAELASSSGSEAQPWRGAYVNFQGVPVMSTIVPMPGSDWLVVSELAQSEAFAVSQKAILLLGGGMSVLAVLVTWVTVPYLERLLFRPIAKLRAGAERIGEGDLRYHVDIAGQDEVGQVAAAFNEMVRRLREREEQLATRTDALASEVARRSLVEEALRQERDRAQRYLDTAQVMLVALNDRGEIGLINREGARTLGYEAHELLGKDWFDTCLPAPDREPVRAVFAELMAGHTAAKESYRNAVLTKSGEERIVSWRNTVLLDDRGSIVGTLSSGEDITERLRAERELDRAEARYRTLFEGVPVGLYRTTPQGEIQDGNPALVRLLSYPDLETLRLANAVDFFVNPDERRREVALLEHDGIVRGLEVQVRRFDGTVAWMQDTVRAVRDDRGLVQYYEGSLEDITDRKWAEESLRESEEKYRNVVERASDGVAIIQDSVLQYANPRLADILRARVEELIGTRFAEWIAPEELATVGERYERRMAGENVPATYETVLRNRYGEKVYAELNAGTVTYQGRAADLAIVRDITERKRAEEALVRERILLRTVIDNLPDAIYVKDKEARKVLANPTDVRNIGLESEAELLGKTDWEVYPPEVATPFSADDQSVLQTGTPVLDREELLVNASGQRRWLLTSKLPLRDENGQVTGLVGIGHDITERREMEDALGRYARRLETLHEIDSAILAAQSAAEIAKAALQRIRRSVPGTGAGIVTLDLGAGEATLLAVDTDAPTAMRAGARLPLHEGAHLETLRQGEVLALDDMSQLFQPQSTAEAHGVYPCILSPLMVHDELTGALVLTAEDPTVFASEHVEIVREVANQIAVAMQNARVQAALDAETRRLKTLLDNMPEGILLLGEANQILLVNPIGQEMLSRLNGGAPDGAVAHLGPHSIEAVLEAHSLKPLTITIREPVEQILELSTHAIYSEKQRRQGAIIVLRDVTELRRVEEQARQQDRLAAIGQLAGGVAHDFNNVLTAVEGYTHLLYEALRSDDPLDWPPASEIRADLEQISEAGERAAGLSRQLLAFSRRQPLQPQVLDLNVLVSNMQQMLARLIGEHVTLITGLEPGLWLTEADPGQIEQVIMNLAVNARDAMPQGGRLTIETACVTLGDEYIAAHRDARPGDYVRLTISDTGTGMSAHVLEHLFEPFFTTKETGKGTGLGLSTVYGIVKQSGGEIEAQTLLGVGTTFSIYLPRSTQVSLARQPDAAEPAPGGSETILLVEDEDAVRELAHRILARLGYSVLAAGRPTEALLLSERHPGHIDLLLTDVVMPEMNGMEVAARLTQIRPRTQVLYMSGYTDDVIESQGVSPPGIELILKPFTPNALARKVRTVLEKREKPGESTLAAVVERSPSPDRAPEPAHFWRTVADLEPGDNLCWFYETEAEHRAVVTPFLRLGLERGEKVLYLAGAHAPETILAYLRDDGLDVRPYLSRGQLSIIGGESAHRGEQTFDADAMISLLRAETEAALGQAYAAVRVTGEMPWGVRQLSGSEQVIEYEARLAESLSAGQCLAIWQYDRRRFEAPVLLDVLRTHPTVMIGARLYDNLYYASPTEPLASDPAQSTLAQWLRNVQTRQLIEQTLHESEHRFRSFVEQSEDGILLTDEQGTITEWNHGAERIFGLDRKQVLGQKLWDILFRVYPEGQKAPTAYERLKDTLSGLFDMGQGSWLNTLRESEIQRPDGTRRTVQSSSFAIRTAKGFTVGNISRDVTQRRQVEEALLKSEARYRALIEQIPAIIYISSLTESNTSFYVSPQVQRILGYSQTEWGSSSQLWLRQLHAEDRRRVLAALARSHESGEPLNQEYRLLSRDGRALWFHDAAVVVRDDSGSPLFLQGIMLDITDRKQAEEELHQRATELVLLNEIGRQIVADLDLDSVLQRAAQLVQHSFGYDWVAVFVIDQERGDLVMRAYSGPYAHPDSTALRCRIGEGIVGSVAALGERILAGDVHAEPRYVNLHPAALAAQSELSVPIRAGEGLVGVLDVQSAQLNAFDQQDIPAIETVADQVAAAIKNARLYAAVQRELAERMRAEAALKLERANLAQRVEERTAELSIANAELARAARLKDEFLANMSHELRTPLNAILGLSEALQEEVYGSLSDGQRKSLHSIEDSGRHLLTLVNDILDLAKVEAGKLTLQIGPVAVGAVCQASLTMVKQLAHKKQLKVSSTIDPQVSTLQADERQLKQILVNLLSNAVKFTPEGGAVGLEVVGDREQEVVHLTVWDTGIGISQEDLKRLFQPFAQLDSGLSRQYSGTGLGLSLVRRLAELHGGGVSVQSEPGKGSQFMVSLPWVEASASVEGATVSPEPQRSPDLGTPRPESRGLVLLAEDNETNVSLFRDYLVYQGYRVVVARNGREAVEQAKEERPDVVLMDVQMPEIDGITATRRLRADVSLADVPVIALTALAMPGDRERCLEAGANDYLSKPISLRTLVQAVETQLSGRSRPGH